jgi:hypothetical protein
VKLDESKFCNKGTTLVVPKSPQKTSGLQPLRDVFVETTIRRSTVRFDTAPPPLSIPLFPKPHPSPSFRPRYLFPHLAGYFSEFSTLVL